MNDDLFYGLWCLIIGIMVGVFITALVFSERNRLHDMQFIEVSKKYIVEEGYGKWTQNNEIIFNNNTMKYYGWRLVK